MHNTIDVISSISNHVSLNNREFDGLNEQRRELVRMEKKSVSKRLYMMSCFAKLFSINLHDKRIAEAVLKGKKEVIIQSLHEECVNLRRALKEMEALFGSFSGAD